ncbi:sensor histidine kinase [Mucilaginibacter ginkgonis]|uniref:histidine kinase n=1 Tax=Mucilaginibacter ginkgonis TaxID=2682091 RepID=A0A6I4HVD6_9SPHI|nr:CHASE3 domain-containing protein [Mucilaginibacter ginkgonis]QQL49944.1 CHASE3 domain-containing protein [Mucilaginibacter ginkgonis]
MNLNLNRKLQVGYGISIVVLIIIGFVSWFTLRNLLDSNRAVSHSVEIMQKYEQILSAMKDAETGQRGYLITGQTKYLQPYNGAYLQSESLALELKKLTADNSAQQKNIKIIQDILGNRLDILKQLVEKKQAAKPILSSDLDAGKSAMDALRNAIAKGEQDERQLLNARNEKLLNYTNFVPVFILIAMLITLGITLRSYRNVAADIQEKDILRRNLEVSEEETQTLNEELSAANEEISSANEELSAINEELCEARDNLVNANQTLEKRVTDRTKALQDSEEETQALNEELTAINEELTATNEDLTDSKEKLQLMLDELKIAEERSAKLAAIVESSDDAIIGKDLDGVITAWNRGAEIIFGYREADMVGNSILKLIPAHLHHEEPVILGRLRNGEKIDHYETVRQTSDGRQINVSLTISPIKDKEGKVIGVSKIARDITEQKRDDQRKSDFIGMASHELKTPLTSLTALIQVLQHKLKTNPDPFVPQALDKAKLQSKKMSSLINGFLNVSRLESGKLEIVTQDFELSQLVDELIDEIKLTASTHEFIFKDRANITVNADSEKIGSVISNLLSNAVKYSPNGKTVTIRLKVVDEQAEFSVEDQGLGINQKDLPRIFDRYYRAGSEHIKQISGFGVGLYLSAEIIERHHGRIWAESETGKGSTFYFKLPLKG